MSKYITRREQEDAEAAKAALDRRAQIISGVVQFALGVVKWGGLGLAAAVASYFGTHWPW